MSETLSFFPEVYLNRSSSSFSSFSFEGNCGKFCLSISFRYLCKSVSAFVQKFWQTSLLSDRRLGPVLPVPLRPPKRGEVPPGLPQPGHGRRQHLLGRVLQALGDGRRAAGGRRRAPGSGVLEWLALLFGVIFYCFFLQHEILVTVVFVGYAYSYTVLTLSILLNDRLNMLVSRNFL